MGTIYLTQQEFDDLLDYSISQPTGVIIDKEWKRGNYVFKANGKTYNAGYLPPKAELVEKRWFHYKYVKSDKPGYVETEMKRIKIVGALDIDKTIMKFNDRKEER